MSAGPPSSSTTSSTSSGGSKRKGSAAISNGGSSSGAVDVTQFEKAYSDVPQLNVSTRVRIYV